mmetsp:Transcript_14551/g.37704  ORF Transcript_14551/g.37704 Transcript_14551/m.37704 type:complete len:86 (-) Transcript_14551:579-836(-)
MDTVRIESTQATRTTIETYVVAITTAQQYAQCTEYSTNRGLVVANTAPPLLSPFPSENENTADAGGFDQQAGQIPAHARATGRRA